MAKKKLPFSWASVFGTLKERHWIYAGKEMARWSDSLWSVWDREWHLLLDEYEAIGQEQAKYAAWGRIRMGWGYPGYPQTEELAEIHARAGGKGWFNMHWRPSGRK